MKSTLFLLAALVAFFALPFDLSVKFGAVVAVGVLAIMAADYAKPQRRFGMNLGPQIARSKQTLQLAA